MTSSVAQSADGVTTIANVFSQLPKVWAKKYGGSGMVVDPSDHPQHMNNLKHLVYVWSGWGNYSKLILGLNQCTMTSFVAQLRPRNLTNSRISRPTSVKVGMMVDPSAPPQHMIVLKHIVYGWSGGGNHSMWMWCLKQCTMTSLAAQLIIFVRNEGGSTFLRRGDFFLKLDYLFFAFSRKRKEKSLFFSNTFFPGWNSFSFSGTELNDKKMA